MGIDYGKYGVDASVATDANVARNLAIEATIAAFNAEVAVLVEPDEEDRAILEERRDEAAARAEALRREAKMTKGELKAFRAQAVQSKQMELARRHLQLEATAKAKEAAKESAKAERDEQASIEAGLAAIERV
jgi:hypothetical protein